MRMSLQYMLDMEKEKSQTALFKCYDFRGGGGGGGGEQFKVITLWFAILYRCAKFN